MLNLAIALEESAKRWPERPALIAEGRCWSYRKLDQRANRVAAGLVAAGILPGDRVALSCPNIPEFAAIYYGILKAGAVVVPLNILCKEREIAYHLEDSGAKAYFCFEGTATLPRGKRGQAGFIKTKGCELFVVICEDDTNLEEAASLAEFLADQPSQFDTAGTAAEDTAVILYTSGTTGKPKGAELSHLNMVMNAIVVRDITGLKQTDVGVLVLPLFHSFGQTVQMNASVLAGAANVLHVRFEAGAVLESMQQHSATIFAGVPTMYSALLNEKIPDSIDLEHVASTLRVCCSGGAALSVGVLRKFEKRFRVTILEGYGLSETSPVACFNHLDRERKIGSIGTPVWGVSMKIDSDSVDPDATGEVLIRGHNVMKGYYRRPKDTAQALKDGWLHTGDVGRVDEDGYFFIVDRMKDMIIRGGFNVYPREIEEVIMEHPGVSLVAVVGIPDPHYGEEIKAFVVPSDQSVPEEELLRWCKDELASYKYPRQIEYRESLPLTATGKVLKRKLQDSSD